MASAASPTNCAKGEHYTWSGLNGMQSDGWHLVRVEDLIFIEERMPPGAAEVRHCHQRARQFFYVLAGELTMEVSGQEHVLAAGNGIEISPGTWHQAMNLVSEDARFLVVSQPPSHGDRIVAA